MRVVVQGEPLNRSRIATPGNVLLPAAQTGLPKDSVANVSQIVILDRSAFTEHAGRLQGTVFQLVLAGIDVVLGR